MEESGTTVEFVVMYHQTIPILRFFMALGCFCSVNEDSNELTVYIGNTAKEVKAYIVENCDLATWRIVEVWVHEQMSNIASPDAAATALLAYCRPKYTLTEDWVDNTDLTNDLPHSLPYFAEYPGYVCDICNIFSSTIKETVLQHIYCCRKRLGVPQLYLSSGIAKIAMREVICQKFMHKETIIVKKLDNSVIVTLCLAGGLNSISSTSSNLNLNGITKNNDVATIGEIAFSRMNQSFAASSEIDVTSTLTFRDNGILKFHTQLGSKAWDNDETIKAALSCQSSMGDSLVTKKLRRICFDWFVTAENLVHVTVEALLVKKIDRKTQAEKKLNIIQDPHKTLKPYACWLGDVIYVIIQKYTKLKTSDDSNLDSKVELFLHDRLKSYYREILKDSQAIENLMDWLNFDDTNLSVDEKNNVRLQGVYMLTELLWMLLAQPMNETLDTSWSCALFDAIETITVLTHKQMLSTDLIRRHLNAIHRALVCIPAIRFHFNSLPEHVQVQSDVISQKHELLVDTRYCCFKVVLKLLRDVQSAESALSKIAQFSHDFSVKPEDFGRSFYAVDGNIRFDVNGLAHAIVTLHISFFTKVVTFLNKFGIKFKPIHIIDLVDDVTNLQPGYSFQSVTKNEILLGLDDLWLEITNVESVHFPKFFTAVQTNTSDGYTYSVNPIGVKLLSDFVSDMTQNYFLPSFHFTCGLSTTRFTEIATALWCNVDSTAPRSIFCINGLLYFRLSYNKR